MAALGEIPFAAYYGSVDATPLFVLLAGRYYHRTGDDETIRRLWPHIEAALAWMDRDGDMDGDGFVEYARATERGLQNQGWKDSHDAIFHAAGPRVEGPVALCEVQGYAYARIHAAELAAVLDDEPRAAALRVQAERLAWRSSSSGATTSACALALDGAKRPCAWCRQRRQCLMSGIVSRERGRVAEAVMRDGVFSGWGVRTIREGEARYNPMAYHNGSIWPHVTALVALGLAMGSSTTWCASPRALSAAQQFELRRLPELFTASAATPARRRRAISTACSPQAGRRHRRCSSCRRSARLRRHPSPRHPAPASLPSPLEWVHFCLTVRDAGSVLLCEQRGDDVGTSVMRRGDVALIRAMASDGASARAGDHGGLDADRRRGSRACTSVSSRCRAVDQDVHAACRLGGVRFAPHARETVGNVAEAPGDPPRARPTTVSSCLTSSPPAPTRDWAPARTFILRAAGLVRAGEPSMVDQRRGHRRKRLGVAPGAPVAKAVARCRARAAVEAT